MQQAFENWRSSLISIAPNIFYAILIMAIGIIAARLVKRWLRPILDRGRIGNDNLLKNFFLRAISLSIILVSTVTALSKIGWDVRTFIAGFGVTGIIVGFAFKDTLSNFASGLLLLIYRPFRAGQTIEVEGSRGTVYELTIVNMQMITSDGVRVIMPNSKVWGAKIINYSLSQSRRLDLKLKVNQEKVEDALQSIDKVLSEDDRVLKAPPHEIRVAAIEGDAATLDISAWTTPTDFSSVGKDIYIVLRSALNSADVQIL